VKKSATEEVMKVLLAIDDSQFSEAATQILAAQFRPQDTEVRVLHVIEPIILSVPPQMAQGYTPEMSEIRQDQLKKARELVAQAAQALRAAGFRVDTAVKEGDIKAGIVDTAAEWPADLIVLGSHGRKGLQRFLLGSVSEAVARHAHCSIEIVRMPVGR